MLTAANAFRRLCAERGIAVTHQRQVLYETMQAMHGHPSPEEVYAEMKQRIPSVSLATVYKNIHLFVASGVFRELSMHHGTLRVEMNGEEHHHMVCSICRSITDLEDKDLKIGLPQEPQIVAGFLVERYAVDVIGVCPACQAAGMLQTAVPDGAGERPTA
jgi:Fur family peroxide stress response transcriptional regulator